MTSCYSGHWVETTEFQGPNNSTEPDQESFGFSWSHSPTPCQGLFFLGSFRSRQSYLMMLKEALLVSINTLTHAIASQMHRLCLPVNIPEYGSSPKHCFSIFYFQLHWQRLASRGQLGSPREGDLVFVTFRTKSTKEVCRLPLIRRALLFLRHL